MDNKQADNLQAVKKLADKLEQNSAVRQAMLKAIEKMQQPVPDKANAPPPMHQRRAEP